MHTASAVCLALALVAVVNPAEAQDSPAIDPRADQILREASAYLAELDQFTFHAEVVEDDTLNTGELVQFGRSVDVAVRRPDRMWADVKGERGHKRFWYDGRSVTLYDYVYGTYAQTTVPNTIDAALDDLANRYGVVLPLSDFGYSDLYAKLIDKIESGIYVGMREVNGVPYHHLAFSQQSIDWEIWIEDGARAVPAKLLIVYKDQDGSPHFSAILSKWELASLPDELFTFEVPAGAQKIEFVLTGSN